MLQVPLLLIRSSSFLAGGLGSGGKDDDSNPQPWLKVHPNGEELDVLQALPGGGSKSSGRKDASKGGGGAFIPDVTHTFKYDRAFHPSNGQDSVFEEVSEFVQSALDGYNVCLFSYGQTGSGKTHTMQGVGTGAMRGIIPRAVEQVARYKDELSEQGIMAISSSVALLFGQCDAHCLSSRHDDRHQS